MKRILRSRYDPNRIKAGAAIYVNSRVGGSMVKKMLTEQHLFKILLNFGA